MKKNERLTSEDLRLVFVNQFNLCLFAIDIAQKLIKSGQPAPLATVLELTRDQAAEIQAAKPF